MVALRIKIEQRIEDTKEEVLDRLIANEERQIAKLKAAKEKLHEKPKE